MQQSTTLVYVQKRGFITDNRAHPVGAKARKAAKMSPTVRLRRENRMPRVPTKPMNSSSLRSLNMSWKSALNFFLPIDTTFSTSTTATMTSHDRPYT
jgi:hypothetical protein